MLFESVRPGALSSTLIRGQDNHSSRVLEKPLRGEQSSTGDGSGASSNVKADPRPTHPKTVLIVDDCPANTKLVEAILRGMGHLSDVAADGREALELVLGSGKRYDLIFMDLQMPELNGFEATEAIRSSDLGYQPTIIALTGNCHDQDRRSAMSVGMDDFLAKPVRVKMIRETVNKWASCSSVAAE